MISRQEYNELIRKAGRERLKFIRDKYYSSDAKFYEHFGGVHKQLSEEEKQNIRDKLKARSRKSNRRILIVFIIAILIVGYLSYLVLLSLSHI